jgi:hypothetical protein
MDIKLTIQGGCHHEISFRTREGFAGIGGWDGLPTADQPQGPWFPRVGSTSLRRSEYSGRATCASGACGVLVTNPPIKCEQLS